MPTFVSTSGRHQQCFTKQQYSRCGRYTSDYCNLVLTVTV